MFGSNASLPRPSAFAQERRPLRLTSDTGWLSPPGGPCHYVLLHPSVPNQRCSCQCFIRNPNAPGTACDCGHQSCYHVPSDDQQLRTAAPTVTESSLMERINRLEETIQHERDMREAALEQERASWAREVRVLREALAPFYESERQMHGKLVELEDRIEGNYDEQVRLRERLVVLDDANMGLEKRFDDLENNRTKRRRTSRLAPTQIDARGSSSGDDRRTSSVTDKISVSSVSSQALSHGRHVSPPLFSPEEPRSSGILNLVDMTSRSHVQQFPIRNIPSRNYEARSSGFLALDLADRLGQSRATPTDVPRQGFAYPPAYSALQSPPDYSQSDTDAALRPLSFTSQSKPPTSTPDLSPRKRKHVALDVLADVSVASPPIHG